MSRLLCFFAARSAPTLVAARSRSPPMSMPPPRVCTNLRPSPSVSVLGGFADRPGGKYFVKNDRNASHLISNSFFEIRAISKNHEWVACSLIYCEDASSGAFASLSLYSPSWLQPANQGAVHPYQQTVFFYFFAQVIDLVTNYHSAKQIWFSQMNFIDQ